jgi:RNA 3'-terminal phosphate cyclase (ATP)
MIEIDGSVHSGSGTILRYSVALATLLHEPLHLIRIRAGRDKPGLRPQHLKAVQACSSLSGGTLEGATVGAQEIFYHPGPSLKGGQFHWDIGTAGSTTMLAYSLLPIALFADAPCHLSLTGGLFQDFAPSLFHMQRALIPSLQKMGARVEIAMVRPGYVPQGLGHIQMSVFPVPDSLKPISMPEQGKVTRIDGIALASHLEKEKVAERMALHGKKILAAKGYEAKIKIWDDRTSVQKGAAFFLRAQTDRGILLGADQAGKLGRRSETIAEFVAASLLKDLSANATVDRHLADQLILFAALARGRSRYSIPFPTSHVESNLWLVEKLLGAKTHRVENILHVEGIGFQRQVI